MDPIYSRHGLLLTATDTGGLRASITSPMLLTMDDIGELVRALQAYMWSEPVRAHLREHERLREQALAAYPSS